MFTGIIEEIGIVQNISKRAKSSVLTIQGKTVFSDIHLGDSISANGVCLTISSFANNLFTADVMHETINRSSLGSLKIGNKVNLERAMSANSRFGGHIVSGHIDGTGTIVKIEKDDNAIWYTIKTTDEILKYIIEKGSIAIDGISLTVAKVAREEFSVSIIPHTTAKTILKDKKISDIVNLENDCIGKYVEKLLGYEKIKAENNITKEFLLKYGY